MSITEASRNFTKLVKSLPQNKYFVVMKNYKPVAKIVAPEPEEEDEGIKILEELRKRAWGGRTRLIQEAFERLENVPDEELPLLLRDA